MDPAIATLIGHAFHAVTAVFGTVAAVYLRGDAEAEIQVTLTQSRAWYQTPEDGLATRIEQTQFMVRPAQIDFGAGPVEPKPGDRLQFESGEFTLLYEVRPPQSGEPCSAAVDPFGKVLRVHAKLIARTVTTPPEEEEEEA